MSIQKAKEALNDMATPEFTREVAALVRSRAPLIYLVTHEEKRLIEYFRNYSIAGSYRTYIWDCYNGIIDIKSMEKAGAINNEELDPNAVLDLIIKEAVSEESVSRQRKESDRVRDEKAKDQGSTRGNIYILLDFHRFLTDCAVDVERRLRTLARTDSNTVVFLVGPHYTNTAALDKDIRVIDFPPPNNSEIRKALDELTEPLLSKLPNLKADIKKSEEEIINAVKGLSKNEMMAAFGKTLCMHREMHIPTILKEKQEIIRKTGILEFFHPGVGIDDIGGLGNLVDCLKLRKTTFSQEAKDYGLPIPKGVLLLGVPGTGKSLAAKAAASLFNMPLLRLDFGSLFSQYVGESEKHVRSALKIAEQLSPVVLWADEIDKGLAGNKSSGSTDSGVTARVIATFLTWMQEKTAPVFLMCTANQHDCIPTEFMRAGRFDEVFFVDVPSRGERISITEKLIKRKNRNPKDFDIEQIAMRSDGYTGAELEKAIDNALLIGFQENKRVINTEDIINALGRFKPISVLRPDAIEAMRVWAEGKCIKANTPDGVPGIDGQKLLDID